MPGGRIPPGIVPRMNYETFLLPWGKPLHSTSPSGDPRSSLRDGPSRHVFCTPCALLVPRQVEEALRLCFAGQDGHCWMESAASEPGSCSQAQRAEKDLGVSTPLWSLALFGTVQTLNWENSICKTSTFMVCRL